MSRDLPNVHDDLKYAVGLEEYQFYKLGSNYERVRSRNVHVRQISAREAAASGGAYTTLDAMMRIPASEFVRFEPEVGGLVESIGRSEVWYIIQVMPAVKRTRWLLVLRGSVSVNSLTEKLMIEAPDGALDEDMSPTNGWKVIEAGVPSFVQETGMTMATGQERRRIRVDFKVYLKSQKKVMPGMRLLRENGDYLHVVGVSGQGVLGSLLVVDAVRPAGPKTS